MPQSLAYLVPQAEFSIVNTPCRENPELSLLAMTIISEWSNLELQVNRLFVYLLGESAETAATVFATIRSQQGQREAVMAVAAVRVDQPIQDVIAAALAVYKNASKLRNRVAHWLWGHCNDISRGVILVDPIAYTAAMARATDWARAHAKTQPPPSIGPEHRTKLNSRAFVYVEDDFKRGLTQLRRAISLLSDTAMMMLAATDEQRAPRLHQLSSEPEIRKELDRLNKGRQNDR